MIIVLIGPMGCGKTTVGRLLAVRLGWAFDDADDFHPKENVDKMRAGIPLDDSDRQGWLTTLKGRIDRRIAAGENLVLACSALKKNYRDLLGIDQRLVVSVYLKGDFDLLRARIEGRNHQYMNKDLLTSQLATMEEPADGLILDIGPSPKNLAEEIAVWLKEYSGAYKMKNMKQIGLAGLAVMGENLVLNMADKGFSVAVYNRTTAKVDAFLAGRAKGKTISGFHTVKDFVAAIEQPRKIMMMLRAGEAVDQFIGQMLPYLSPGDIIIDGGNSNYHDTIRRTRELEEKGFLFIGTGVSGGEEGALKGPSIMPGGSAAAWSQVKPIFTAIAARAKDNEPCCAWMGPDGAGHFVKMVHNGIEYGDMQLICEAYQVMRDLLGMDTAAMHKVFYRWNEGDLQSYLIEITAAILDHREEEGVPTIDLILDAAGQKGTGKWTVNAALDYGVPLSLISESVFARCISAQKELRGKAALVLAGPTSVFIGEGTENEKVLRHLEKALYCAKIVSYTQGFSLLHEASLAFGWDLDFAAIARIWRGGCIIRSVFLDRIAAAYQHDASLANLLLAPSFAEEVNEAQDDLRAVVGLTAGYGIAAPCLSAALSYYDGLRTKRLAANLLQAQRDYFGAHTYERIDRPRGEFFHTDWTGSGGATTSTAYIR
jgi:6-phosphogluconate dehydrogenase